MEMAEHHETASTAPPQKVMSMLVRTENASVVRLENGTYRLSLPGYGEVVIALPEEPVHICRSCHRELTDTDEIALTVPTVCVRCYAT